jgi:hypothetical protein
MQHSTIMPLAEVSIAASGMEAPCVFEPEVNYEGAAVYSIT